MARPMATTPTLRGLEALRFMEKMENVKPISEERREEMKKITNFLNQEQILTYEFKRY